MNVYSINDLQNLSGVKAHTLRIWEKRYNLLKPKRTETNIRYYLDSDLQFLLNVAFLNKHGFKISKIAKMSSEEIKKEIANHSSIDLDGEKLLDSLTLAMFEFEEYNFNRILDRHIEENGFKYTMLSVIYPLLDKITMMWIAGSVKKAHESFIVQIIRKKNITVLDHLAKERPTQDKKFLIYLPPNENQELSLLFLEFILRKNGYRTLNLGLEAQQKDILDACDTYAPDYIMSIFNESFNDESLEDYIKSLTSHPCNPKFIATGFIPVKQRLKQTDQCLVKNSLDEVIGFLSK